MRKRQKKLKLASMFVGTGDKTPLNKLFMSELKETELKLQLERLNIDKTPQEVVLEQWTYLLGAALATLIMFTANSVPGLITALLVPVCWYMPADKIRKQLDTKNHNITIEFPEFYSMAYYQYSRSINVYLSDVIRDYLPNAGEDLAGEFQVMLDNIDYADEQYALRQLKRRIPIHSVIKFCDILETRLRGYDNVSQMQYLKNEMDRDRVTILEKELNKRVDRNNAIQMILIGVLILYIVIYYFFTVIGSINLFR